MQQDNGETYITSDTKDDVDPRKLPVQYLRCIISSFGKYIYCSKAIISTVYLGLEMLTIIFLLGFILHI